MKSLKNLSEDAKVQLNFLGAVAEIFLPTRFLAERLVEDYFHNSEYRILGIDNEEGRYVLCVTKSIGVGGNQYA